MFWIQTHWNLECHGNKLIIDKGTDNQKFLTRTRMICPLAEFTAPEISPVNVISFFCATSTSSSTRSREKRNHIQVVTRHMELEKQAQAVTCDSFSRWAFSWHQLLSLTTIPWKTRSMSRTKIGTFWKDQVRGCQSVNHGFYNILLFRYLLLMTTMIMSSLFLLAEA